MGWMLLDWTFMKNHIPFDHPQMKPIHFLFTSAFLELAIEINHAVLRSYRLRGENLCKNIKCCKCEGKSAVLQFDLLIILINFNSKILTSIYNSNQVERFFSQFSIIEKATVVLLYYFSIDGSFLKKTNTPFEIFPN